MSGRRREKNSERGEPIHAVKLGGSLLDLPDLVARFEAYRRAEMSRRSLLVVGGGEAADVVRRFDRHFALGATAAHWLAVRAMQFNTWLCVAVLPKAALVESPEQCDQVWRRGQLAVMDPLAWLRWQEAQSGQHIPHHWQFTSDSITAQAAQRLGAQRLTVLKSTLPAARPCPVAEAVRLELVDGCFPEAASELPCVELVNLRDPARPRCQLAFDARVDA